MRTRLEWRQATRGASLWVVEHADSLPDCTAAVVFSNARRRPQICQKSFPASARRARLPPYHPQTTPPKTSPVLGGGGGFFFFFFFFFLGGPPPKNPSGLQVVHQLRRRRLVSQLFCADSVAGGGIDVTRCLFAGVVMMCLSGGGGALAVGEVCSGFQMLRRGGPAGSASYSQGRRSCVLQKCFCASSIWMGHLRGAP